MLTWLGKIFAYDIHYRKMHNAKIQSCDLDNIYIIDYWPTIIDRLID